MSRVAKKPIPLPEGVKADFNAPRLTVQGPKGQLSLDVVSRILIESENNQLLIRVQSRDPFLYAMGGTTRALVANMVHGVKEGFEKRLILKGVGYRAELKGKSLGLTLGLSHPVNHPIPEGIAIELPSQTEIIIKGIDKQLVGQVAADIRQYRRPEPYKGKGIRYHDEVIKLKEGKKK
jgi:large subunit ribosomal protein L6